MAARMLQRRLGSLLLRNRQPNAHLFKDCKSRKEKKSDDGKESEEVPMDHLSTPKSMTSSMDQFVPSASSILGRYGFDQREIQTQTNPINPANECLVNLEDSRLKPKIDANAINSSNAKFADASTQKISPRHDLAMLFTCKVCETRSMKTCSRESYEKGVVVARCGGCNNLHLIADHLGYFGQPSSIEQFLAARGEEVKKGSADTLNLTLEDIAGKKPGEGAEVKQLE